MSDIRFAFAEFSSLKARELAIRTDPRTASDDRYVLKTYINENFGENVFRPWRLMGSGDSFSVVGCLQPGASPDFAALLSNGGIETALEDWPLAVAGTRTEMEFELSAVKVVRPASSEGKRVYMDVSVKKTTEPDGRVRYIAATGDDLVHAYAAWLFNEILDGDYGFSPAGIPRIVSAAPLRHYRKGGGQPKLVLTPRMLARMKVEVTDPVKLAATLYTGMRRMKDIGLGSVIPCEVLERRKAAA